jgi:transposase
MIGLPAGTHIWIAAGVTDLRRGFTGLSGMVQMALKENPFSGHVFVFRANHNGERTVAANSLQNDPVLIKFSNCGRFLSSMLGSGSFADNPSCH